MPEKSIKIKIGLTIFVGILLFFAFIFMIGTDDYLFSKTYNLNLYLDDATGLVEGAPVTLGGYKVGDVGNVEFIPANDKRAIKITLRILEEYQHRITVNSHAEVSSIGILGDKFINITVGTPDEQPLADNDTISVTQTISLENLANAMSPGINNLNNILKNLSLISDTIASGKGNVGKLIMNDEIVVRLEESLTQTQTLLENVNNKNGSLGKLIYDDSLYISLVKMSDGVNNLLAEIESGKGTLGKLVTNDSLYNNLNSVSGNLNFLAEQAGNDSSVVNGLFTDKELYYKLKESIQNINILVEDIKENPGKYINVSVF